MISTRLSVNRRYSLVLLLTAITFAHALPANFGPVDVPMRPDGSIVLRSHESIHLQFEIQNDKLINPKVVAPDAATVTLWIERKGGKKTQLGPVTPIRDILRIESHLPGIVVVRCAYTTPNTSKPRTAPSARNGYSFDGPITEATLSNFTLKKQ